MVAKIYLIAFEEYRTAYVIANKLGIHNYQVSREVNERFPNLFDRKEEWEKRKPLRSETNPFLEELDKSLKIKLNPHEREELRHYIDGPFRKAVDDKYLEVDYSLPVDAYSELLGLLLVIMRVKSHVRNAASTMNALTRTPEEKLRVNYRRAWREIPKDLELGPVPWDEDEILEPIAEFSDALLDKVRKTNLTGSREIVRKYSHSSEEFFTRIMNVIKNQNEDDPHSKGFNQNGDNYQSKGFLYPPLSR